jgi:Putative adhesin
MKAARYLGLILMALAISALPLSAASTGHFERTLQVSGPVDLDVTSGSGDITVRTGGSGTVSVSAKLRASKSWLFGDSNAEERIGRIEKNPPVEQHGNTIRIGRFEDRELTRNISIDYEITVPAQTRLNSQTGSGDQTIGGVQLPLTAKTGSGNITVDNVAGDARISSGSGDLKINDVKGSLHADTGSGNIHAEGIAGEITASAGSGNVELHQVAAGDIKVETGSGNVKLRGIKGGLRASTGSGDIHAEGEATHDWRLGAGSGNITLHLPAQASFDLDARTSSGTLRLNRPVTTQGTISKSHVQGKVGNGGVILDVHTGSGDIALD